MLAKSAKPTFGTQMLSKSEGTLGSDGSETAPSCLLLPHVLIELLLALLLIDWHGDPILLMLFIFVGV